MALGRGLLFGQPDTEAPPWVGRNAGLSHPCPHPAKSTCRPHPHAMGCGLDMQGLGVGPTPGVQRQGTLPSPPQPLGMHGAWPDEGPLHRPSRWGLPPAFPEGSRRSTQELGRWLSTHSAPQATGPDSGCGSHWKLGPYTPFVSCLGLPPTPSCRHPALFSGLCWWLEVQPLWGALPDQSSWDLSPSGEGAYAQRVGLGGLP